MRELDTKRKYRFALSFPGEYEQIAKGVADVLILKYGREKVFYYVNHEEKLGKNAAEELQNIFRNETDFVLVFFGPVYMKKEWCVIEFKSICELMDEKPKNKDRVMFIKCEDGDFSGIDLSRDVYTDACKENVKEIAQMASKKYYYAFRNDCRIKYNIMIFDDNYEQLEVVTGQLEKAFMDEYRFGVDIDSVKTHDALYKKNKDKDYDIFILDVATRNEEMSENNINVFAGDKVYETLMNEKPSKDLIPQFYIVSKLSTELIAQQFFNANYNGQLRLLDKGDLNIRNLAIEIKNYLTNDYEHVISVVNKTDDK